MVTWTWWLICTHDHTDRTSHISSAETQTKLCSFHIISISAATVNQTMGGGSGWALNNRYALGTAPIAGWIIKVQRHEDAKPVSHLGKRVKDSLILRDVSEGRDGAPLSPGDGNNLTTQWQLCKWWLLKNGASETSEHRAGLDRGPWCRSFNDPVLPACTVCSLLSGSRREGRFLIHAWADTYRSCLMLLQSTHMVGTLVLQCSWNL